jgi:hypothetical protein
MSAGGGHLQSGKRRMSNEPASSPNKFGAALSQFGAFFGRISLRQKLIAGGAIALVILTIALLSSSGGRAITINGYRLNGQETAYLDAIAGAEVPNGDYWLDPQTMAWGIVGNPQAMGVIGGGGGQGQSPHWADVGKNYRGPFGDYMSDGKCSAVNGIMVGDC